MCMGRTHVLVSGLAALAAMPVLATALHHPLDRPTWAMTAVVAAGFGLLPDLDHPSATMAHTLGPVTKAIAAAVAALSGGHRKGTHTVWAVAAVVLILSSGIVTGRPWIVWGLTATAISLALLAVGAHPLHGRLTGELAAVAEGCAVTYAAVRLIAPAWWWLPYAAGLGVAAHVLADALTDGGVMPLYPASRRKVCLPLIGRTGGLVDTALVPALCVIAAGWLVMTR